MRAHARRQVDLSYKTLPVTATHFDGTLEYNVHNLYSLYEVIATAAALQRLRNRRQFILTRCAWRRRPVVLSGTSRHLCVLHARTLWGTADDAR